MDVYYSEQQDLHDPRFHLVLGKVRRHKEQPKRAELLLEGVRSLGLGITQPEDFGPAPRAAVHSPEYLRFLQEAFVLWQNAADPGPEVVPNMHPNRPPGGYPETILGRAGWHMADGGCPIGPNTWEAACAAGNVAMQGAEALIGGVKEAYSLCRPPGHHAYQDMAGGFCFLNNAAMAAQRLRTRYDRVAILDVDEHHGNGTQAIFYSRADVLHLSIHVDPRQFYPFFWGYPQERGEGEGESFNVNLPLPLGTDDEAYLAVLDRALSTISGFAPGALVIALGLDAYENDPLAGLAVSTDGFKRIGASIGRFGIPTLLVQEGGYLSPDLGLNLASFLSGFLSLRR